MSAPALVGRATWNPLRVGGTSLPPPLLLAAKIMVIAVLIRATPDLPDRYLPFVRLFDHVPAAELRIALQCGCVLGGAAVLFNRAVRTGSLLVGVALLASVLSSQSGFSHNLLFAACALIAIGLYERGRTPWLLCGQVAIVYFGAALNKLVDPDWLSGRFLTAWGHQFITAPRLVLLPDVAGRTGAQVLSGLIIAAEAYLAFAFAVRALGDRWPGHGRPTSRLFSIGIGIGAVLHVGLFVITGRTFGVFLFAVLAAYLALVNWPAAPVQVLYDADCAICTKTKNLFERLDLERQLAWVASRDVDPPSGITRAELNESMHAVSAGGGVTSGFGAVKTIIVLNPLTWLTLTVAFALGTRFDVGGIVPALRVVAAVGLIVLLPVFEPIGNTLYRWFATNRHRFGSPECRLPEH